MNGVEKLRRIQELLREHRTREARPLIEELIHAEPSNIEVWYWRGVCERFDGELDLAENDFLSVIRQNPHHDRAFFGLGDILENMGNHKDAVAAYQQAASLGNKEAAKKLARYGSPLIAKQPAVSPQPQSQQPLQETIEHSAQPDIELKTERGIDYTRLRDLLASGKWKQADQETAKAIHKMLGCNQIMVRDPERLSCSDLYAIDNLWTQYSNGRFGFSVQKKIYQGVGGLVASNGYNPLTFESFSRKVGWCTTKPFPRAGTKSALLGSSQLCYTLSAPPGHLPASWILPPGTTGVYVPGCFVVLFYIFLHMLGLALFIVGFFLAVLITTKMNSRAEKIELTKKINIEMTIVMLFSQIQNCGG